MKKGSKVIAGIVFSIVIAISSLFGITNASMMQPANVSANDITSHLPAKGSINSSGVYGYTDNYVLYGGSQEVQHAVQYGWHVTAKDSYFSHGVTWLECWDTDDGDYYGWIDVRFIDISSYTNNDYYEGGGGNSVSSVSINPRTAEVDGNGVYGYTSNYVLYGGSQQEEHKVQDGWHITAYNTAYSHGVRWYECWDTDDGDYYGWIDANYIYFYDEHPQTQPVQTVIVTVTQKPRTIISERTVIVTVTVTQLVTEKATTQTTTATKAAANGALTVTSDDNDGDENDSGVDGQMIIIIIAAAVIILIAISALLIALLSKKQRIIEKPIDRSFNEFTAANNTSNQKVVFCMNCGAAKRNPNAMFCPECGKPYNNNH